MQFRDLGRDNTISRTWSAGKEIFVKDDFGGDVWNDGAIVNELGGL